MKLLWPLINLLQLAAILTWNTVWITFAALATLVTRNRDTALIIARRWYARPIFRILGARLEESPLPDLDWSRPYIFLMNHQSMVDIPVAFAVVPVNLRFVAKHTLKHIPFLGWYMSMTGMIFINRGKRHEALRSLKEAGARIREGASILAFPEGTRSRDGALLPFKKGAFMLALESGVPIIPVVAEGSGRNFPAGTLFRIRPATIRVKLGAPIQTQGRDASERDALMQEVRDAMRALQAELGVEIAPETEAPKAAEAA